MMDKNQIQVRMDKIVGLFVNDIASIRTGRASPALIENVEVTVYGGQKMALKGLGSIGVADARSLTFQPWDQSIIKEIKNGIAAANISVNPVVDGQLIRISLPAMTGEQREDYVKLLGRKLEGVKNMIRSVRAENRKFLQQQKQAKEISEDEYRREEEELQKLTDSYVEKLSEIAGKKEKEIREV